MWLINARTRELEFFMNECETPYAILSHTWEEDEVSFHDYKFDFENARNKKGYIKIDNTCRQAIEDGHEHVWIDTCCINKDSSAELSEAINAMFWYYETAAICYVFLSDLGKQSDALENCKWFTRGWTLQELVVPKSIHFFKPELTPTGDNGWSSIGDKSGLAEQISHITRIDLKVLVGDRRINSYSVATRMSWAAGRETSRIEDRAYSLLGIFDVNMPLIYGEEERAFERLQKEIINASYDHSIFVWNPGNWDKQRHHLLARSPDNFRDSATVEQWLIRDEKYSHHFTNIGLETNLRVAWIEERYCWVLPCRLKDSVTGPLVLNLLHREPGTSFEDAPPGARWCFYVDRIDNSKGSKILSRGLPLPRGVDQIPLELFREANLVPARIEYHEARDPSESYSWRMVISRYFKGWIYLDREITGGMPSSQWESYVYPAESWPDLNTFHPTSSTMSGIKSWEYKYGSQAFSLVFRLPRSPLTHSEPECSTPKMALVRLEGSPAKFDETTIEKLLDQRQPTLETSEHFEWGSVHAFAGMSKRMGEDVCQIRVSVDPTSMPTPEP